MLSKGYSALEDVPMIVPIALALIIFFASLSWAINTVNSTNRRVDMTLAIIRVADAFAQWGVLTEDTWNQSCNAIKDKEKSIYFLAYLVEPDDLDDSLRSLRYNDKLAPNSVNVHAYDNKRCNSVPLVVPKKVTDVYVRFFPITYQIQNNGVVENDVLFLVVVTWPKE